MRKAKIYSSALLTGASTKTYSAYLLYTTTVKNVNTLGFTDPIDINKCHGVSTNYNGQGTGFIILNNYLYQYTGGSSISFLGATSSSLRTGNKWTAVTGYPGGGYGIYNGKAYYYLGNASDGIKAISSSPSNLVKVYGEYMQSSSGGSNTGYAISSDGKLYRLAENSCTQIGTATNWSTVSAGSGISFGLAGGALYALQGTIATATRVGSASNWKAIAGYTTVSSSGSYACTAISSSGLYSIYSQSGISLNLAVTQMSSDTGWSCVSGQAYSYYGCLAICSGKLYEVGTKYSSNIKQIGTRTDWAYCTGRSSSTYGHAITTDGSVYRVTKDGAVTDTGLRKCVKFEGYTTAAGTYADRRLALAICED